jgi:hypothetical protein
VAKVIRQLGRRYLDLTMHANSHVSIRVVERPGRWMKPADLASLLEGLRAVVARSLAEPSLEYGVLTGDRRRLENAVITVLHDRRSGHPIAFNALTWLEVEVRGHGIEVLHLGLVMVDPAARTQGLSWVLYGLTCLLLFLRNGLRPLWVSSVTQVPAVVGMVCETLAEVFPSPDPGARRSFDHLVIAREIMRHHRAAFGVGAEAGFDEDRFVITDSYTGGSDHLKKPFEAAARHRIEAYNEMCRVQLDYRRGDDFLQIGRFTMAGARNYLLRSVPRASLPALAFQAAFMLLGSIVLPVLYWFTPGQPLGELRPRRP